MSAIYTYPAVSNLVSDLEAQNRVFSPNGKLEQLVINANATTNDGHIFLYFRKFVARYGDLLRFSYSNTDFVTQEFSKQLTGLTLFLNESPTNTVTMWDALPTLTQDGYMATADNLYNKGLLELAWPLPSQL